MRRAVEAVRAARGAGVGVSITYTDRPSNDFSALFETLLNPANEESPLYGNSDVYVFACGIASPHDTTRHEHTTQYARHSRETIGTAHAMPRHTRLTTYDT
jgi:hypothetical protein